MDSNKRQSLMSRFSKPRNIELDRISQLLPDASQEKSESDRTTIEAANADQVCFEYHVWRHIAVDLWTLLCYIYRTVLLVVQQVKKPKLRAPK